MIYSQLNDCRAFYKHYIAECIEEPGYQLIAGINLYLIALIVANVLMWEYLKIKSVLQSAYWTLNNTYSYVLEKDYTHLWREHYESKRTEPANKPLRLFRCESHFFSINLSYIEYPFVQKFANYRSHKVIQTFEHWKIKEIHLNIKWFVDKLSIK